MRLQTLERTNGQTCGDASASLERLKAKGFSDEDSRKVYAREQAMLGTDLMELQIAQKNERVIYITHLWPYGILLHLVGWMLAWGRIWRGVENLLEKYVPPKPSL